MKTRIRSVKPEVHLDEELWDLEEKTGLPVFRAFVGLWNCSDREGRFEWKPRQLKTLILPYWNGDFSRVLDALSTRHFVVGYACGAREFGVVRTFKRHQKINGREARSEIPAPPKNVFDFTNIPTRPSRDADVCGTGQARDDAVKGTGGSPDADAPHARTWGTEQNRTEQNRTDLNARARDPKKDNPEMTVEEFKKTMPESDIEFPEERTGGLVDAPFAAGYLEASGSLWQSNSRHYTNFKNLESFCINQARLDGVAPTEVCAVMLFNFFAYPYARQIGFTPSLLAENPGKFYKPPEGAIEPPDDKPHYEKELKAEKEKLEYLEAHGKTEEAERSKGRVIRLTEMLKEM